METEEYEQFLTRVRESGQSKSIELTVPKAIVKHLKLEAGDEARVQIKKIKK